MTGRRIRRCKRVIEAFELVKFQRPFEETLDT